MKKRILSGFVLLCMLLSLLPVPALAAEPSVSGGIAWTLSDGILTISPATTPEAEYKSGVMPDYAAAANQPWASSRNSISKVVISDGVKTLGDFAFSGASNLTEIDFGGASALTMIGKRALEKTGLTSIAIPDSVSVMKEQCLGENVNLTTVHIGAGLETPGNWMFYGDKALTAVTVSESNTHFYAEDGVLFERGTDSPYHTILLYPSAKAGTSYAIPEGTVHIASYAFQNCTELTSLHIPSTLETYGTANTLGMFQGTNNLERITIAEDNPTFEVDDHGAWVTKDGTAIILFPAKSPVTTYVIDEEVEVIVSSAFAYATNLTTVFYNANLNADESDNTNSYSRFNGAGSENGFQIIIGNNVTSIPRGIFSSSNVTDLTIGSSVEEIGQGAFQNCTKLTEIIIPDNVKRIYGAAFSNCSSATVISLGSGLELFSGDQIFYDCTAVEQIYYNIPNLTWTGEGQATTAPSTNNMFGNVGKDSENGLAVYVGDKVTNFKGIRNCNYVTEVIIEGSPTGCVITAGGAGGRLKNIVISGNVTEIKDNAFNIENSQVEQIVFTGIHDGLTIGVNAFCNVPNSEDSDYDETKKQPLILVLPKSNDTIQKYAGGWNNTWHRYNLRTFILNAEEDEAQFVADDGGSPTAIRNGYKFDGWYTNADGSTSANVEQPGTYYAKWTPNDSGYSITAEDATQNLAMAYGGAPVSATVTVTVPENGSVWKAESSSTAFGTSVSDNIVTITASDNLSAGEYSGAITVYTGSEEDYGTLSIDVNLTVNKADPTLTLSADNGTVYSNIGTTSFAYDYTGDGGVRVETANPDVATATVNGKTVVVNVNGAGETAITVIAAEGRNYHAADAVYVLTVNQYSAGGSVTRYTVTVEDSEGGSVRSSVSRASRGTTVTLTATPDEGYALDSLTVTQSGGGSVSLTDKGDGRYTFTMPRANVTVEAAFVEIKEEPGDTEELPFTDVAEGTWYYDAVAYVYENNMMEGTSATTFAPGMTLSRAMVAQILYNLEEQTGAAADAGFPDVAVGAWYADAVNWAAESGVVTGYDTGAFGPEDAVTREQLAVMLYRYAGSPEPAGSLEGFTDADSASGYAADALRWAVGEGLLTGKDGGRLDPAGTATRAEAAAILTRFAHGSGE